MAYIYKEYEEIDIKHLRLFLVFILSGCLLNETLKKRINQCIHMTNQDSDCEEKLFRKIDVKTRSQITFY